MCQSACFQKFRRSLFFKKATLSDFVHVQLFTNSKFATPKKNQPIQQPMESLLVNPEGWRLPFLLALLPGLLAALGRRSLSESSSFQAAARAEKAAGGAAWRAVMKLKELVVDCWPQVWS